jgi:hypothetical protein
MALPAVNFRRYRLRGESDRLDGGAAQSGERRKTLFLLDL